MTVGTVKQAEQILRAYTEDLDGLTMWECAGVGFSPPQCFVLERVLGRGEEGNVTLPERYQLNQVGFSKWFVQKIAGEDGRNALRRHGRWFAHHCYYGGDCRSVVLKNDEVPALIEALKGSDQDAPWITVGLFSNTEEARAMQEFFGVVKDSVSHSKTASALGKIKDARAVPVLIEALKDGFQDVRWRAAWALGEIGKSKGVSAVAPAISELRRMAVRDPSQDVREEAQRVMEELMGEMR